jgi:hypothetical protein
MRHEMHISPAIIFEQALAPGCYARKVMQMTIAAAFAATLTLSGFAQEFMADAGALAVVFPNPDRPVPNIVA